MSTDDKPRGAAAASMERARVMSTLPTHGRHTSETPRVETPLKQQYTLLAVRQGGQWSSLCPELDIASCGATPEEALDMLQAALVDALQFERDAGVAAGQPVPEADLEAFLEEGRAAGRVATRTVTL